MSGYLYFISDPLVDPIEGYLRLNLTTPPYSLDIANLDASGTELFPLTTTFTQTGQYLENMAIPFLDGNGKMMVTLWINISSEVLHADWTSYTIVSSAVSALAALTPDTVVALPVFWLKEVGPTGAQGVTGPVSTVAGPTGPTSGFGAAALRASAGSQTIANNTATAVALDTVDIATTNSSDLTTNTTTGLITCVATGVYQVTGRVNWTSTVAGGRYELFILVAGSADQGISSGVVVPGSLGASPSDNGTTITSLINVTSANTTIGLEVSHNTGVSQDISGTGSVTSYLFVNRIA